MKKTLLQELNSIVLEKDKEQVLKNRGDHIVNSAINLIAQLHEQFDEKDALDLERRLINSIKGKNPIKLARGFQRIKESKNEDKWVSNKPRRY